MVIEVRQALYDLDLNQVGLVQLFMVQFFKMRNDDLHNLLRWFKIGKMISRYG